jgi:hypothetical protein
MTAGMWERTWRWLKYDQRPLEMKVLVKIHV